MFLIIEYDNRFTQQLRPGKKTQKFCFNENFLNRALLNEARLNYTGHNQARPNET